jgi:Immunoglobulin domain
VSATGTPPLSYQWQRNGANISGATSSSYTLPSAALADSGSQFRCRVSNSIGNVFSNNATLTVISNGVPTPTIITPAAGTLYIAGTTLSYSGNATDPEDGTLAASRFTWQIDFHHDDHTHPGMPATTGSKSGTFDIPNIGETSANVWYRVYLTVVDSAGQSATVYRDVLPRKAQITLATSPSGLGLTLDGQPVTAPYAFVGVVGILRTIGAPSPQPRNGGTYLFQSWSNGGAQTQTITTPTSNVTFTATFRKPRR